MSSKPGIFLLRSSLTTSARDMGESSPKWTSSASSHEDMLHRFRRSASAPSTSWVYPVWVNRPGCSSWLTTAWEENCFCERFERWPQPKVTGPDPTRLAATERKHRNKVSFGLRLNLWVCFVYDFCFSKSPNDFKSFLYLCESRWTSCIVLSQSHRLCVRLTWADWTTSPGSEAKKPDKETSGVQLRGRRKR